MTQDEFMAAMDLAAANQPLQRWKSREPGKLIEWFKDTVSYLVEDFDQEPDDVVVWAKQWYDSIIRPFDLPYIPNLVVEPIVDDFIWKLIEIALRHFLPAKS